MQKLELSIVALSDSVSSPGRYALVLEEPTSQRRIPLLIGRSEAQAIALCLEQLQPARPLTHDLFQATLSALHARLEEVQLVSFEAEIFYAQLVLQDAAGQRLVVDARPSDAIALAVRAACPIFTTSEVLAAAAYLPEQAKHTPDFYLTYTRAELEELLSAALQNQDFELATRLDAALKHRAGPG